jgi:hypothetical protein
MSTILRYRLLVDKKNGYVPVTVTITEDDDGEGVTGAPIKDGKPHLISNEKMQIIWPKENVRDKKSQLEWASQKDAKYYEPVKWHCNPQKQVRNNCLRVIRVPPLFFAKQSLRLIQLLMMILTLTNLHPKEKRNV